MTTMTFETSETTSKLDEALAKAQAKITNAKHNALNPHFEKSYADLAAIWEACRAPLAEAGISVTQWPMVQGNQVSLLTRLAHGGEWMRVTTTFPAGRTDAQGIVGTITYLKRAALGAIVGVAGDGEDDDGNTAANRKGAKDAEPDPRQDNKQGNRGSGPKPRGHAPADGPKPNGAPPAPPKDPGEAIIPFGKNTGKKLADLDDAQLTDLAGFFAKIENPRGRAKDFAPILEAWIALKHGPAHKADAPAKPAEPPKKPTFLEFMAANGWSEAEANEWIDLKYNLPEGVSLNEEQRAELVRVVGSSKPAAALFLLRNP